MEAQGRFTRRSEMGYQTCWKGLRQEEASSGGEFAMAQESVGPVFFGIGAPFSGLGGVVLASGA